MEGFTITFAFLGGLVSFLSPCVLPLIPGFLAYLAGTQGLQPSRRDTFLASVFFVLGFAAVFSLLGVLLNTVLERVAYDFQIWLSRIGGTVIILFGLYLIGLIRIPFLERDHKLRARKFSSRHITSFVFGAAFAVGWTPCVGAVLGGILGLAASAPGSAFTLLFSYSLGLGLPFLLVGLFTAQASGLITKYAHVLTWVSRIFGVLLVVLGVLVFTQTLSIVANLEFLNTLLLE